MKYRTQLRGDVVGLALVGVLWTGVSIHPAAADEFNLSDATLFPGTTIADTTVNARNVQVRLGSYVDYGSLGADNLYFPTDIDFDANGRAFMTQANGQIRILDSAGLLQSTPYAVGEDATDFSVPYDRAMTSVALHPDFLNVGTAGYGKFYTVEASVAFDWNDADFTNPITGKNPFHGQHTSLLYEYTVANPLANALDLQDAVLNPSGADSRRIVLSARQRHHSHNFDDLAFDATGILYLSSGDGGNGNDGTKDGWDKNANTIDNPWGKILRFDPLGIQGQTETFTGENRFSVPTDNPFFDDADGVKIEDIVYAYGVRNPYRISLDSDTGELWASNTGQNNVESFYQIDAGDDFGWGLLEGTFIYTGVSTVENIEPTSIAHALSTGSATFAVAGSPPFGVNRALTTEEIDRLNAADLPVFQYDHTEGASATGGLIYHGDMAPLEGLYVFADYQGVSDTETVDEEGRTIGDGARMFYGDPDTGKVYQFVIDDQGLDVPDRILGFIKAPTGELLVYGLNFTESGGIEGVVFTINDANLAADYDNSGFVGQGDLALVLANWGTAVADGQAPEAGWTNTRGITGTLIGQDELALVLQEWGNTSAILGQLSNITSVTGLTEDEVLGLIPEPGTFVLLAVGGCLTLLRRRP